MLVRTLILLALVAACLAFPARAQEPAGIRHATLTVDGVRLHVASMGSGRLMLFLHGFPEFWYAWRRQLVEFGRDHLAAAPDMRGYNLSDRPAEVDAYAVPALLKDIKGVIDTLGEGKKAILVGHDWGGALAWAYAAAHPETLERLVIVNAPHPAVFARELEKNEAQRKASSYMTLFRSPRAEQLLAANDYAALAMAVFGSTARADAFTEEDRKEYRKAWAQPGALTGGLNYYRAARLGPPADGAPAAPLATLATIRTPTLVIWGEKDTALLTGNLDGLDRHVTELQIERIPEGSHWVVHEQPELISKLIRSFLEKR